MHHRRHLHGSWIAVSLRVTSFSVHARSHAVAVSCFIVIDVEQKAECTSMLNNTIIEATGMIGTPTACFTR